MLAQRALERCLLQTGLEGPTRFSDGALALLIELDYAGNVRQLEGIVLSAYLLARDQGTAEIRIEHLPTAALADLRYRRHGDREANRLVVERSLRVTGGNVKQAARLLGVSRNTLNSARRRA